MAKRTRKPPPSDEPELTGEDAFARAMQLKLKANRKALKAREAREARKARKAAQASEQPDLSGAALGRALDQDILARHPRLTQAELDEFMKYT